MIDIRGDNITLSRATVIDLQTNEIKYNQKRNFNRDDFPYITEEVLPNGKKKRIFENLLERVIWFL